MTRSLQITPETSVAELLNAYPELEDVLIQQAPAFRALKNPVLRRTVARVATLSQAARVGGIPLRPLIVALRQAAGQPIEEAEETSSPAARPHVARALRDRSIEEEGTSSAAAVPLEPSAAAPDWLDEQAIDATIDADALLTAGESPLTKVQSALRELGPGRIVKITSSFRPQPLIDALGKRGVPTYVVQISAGAFSTFARRPESS